MASSLGFSIASSPQGAKGGNFGSPVKAPKPDRKGPTAKELLEQIRHLEAEGNKLRSETSPGMVPSSALSDITGMMTLDKTEVNQVPKFSTATSASALSALVDISAEQKTISDLRLQLERQKEESDRLSSQLIGDGFTSSTSRAGTVLHIPNSPSKTGFSTLPSTELFGARRTTGSSDVNPPSHLEKALKDSQEQVADLRRRLAEANEQSELQRRQFRVTVEELKAKLQESMVNRDSVLDLRQKEAAGQASKIANLEATIHQQQEKLKMQEQSLVEASRKSEGISRENFISETTIGQIRLILVDAERRRGKPYFETDPASGQNPSMLVHTLERCIQELIKDIEIRKSKIEELQHEIEELRQSLSADQQNLSQDYHLKITQMTSEHERQMQQANERASNARKQATALQSQLSMIQGQHDQQLKMKEETLVELENKIKHLREELQEEREKYQTKRIKLEQSVSDAEKEMSKLRGERDDAVKQQAHSESQITDLQLTIKKLTREIESEKENSGKFWEREGQLRSKQSELETRLEEKTKDVDRLEKMLATVKQECNATVSEKVSMIERQERERHLEKISSLTAQLSELSEKSNKMSLELDTVRAESRELRLQSRELTDKADTTKVQLDAAVAEKKHLADMLAAKSSDFDRASQERDYYFNIMDQKNNELAQLKTQKERLTVQLEEKEKNIGILQQQSKDIQQMMEANSRNSESIREERDVYAKQLQSTTVALEELKASRETMAKKMKIREKRIKELETEKQKTAEEIELKTQEMTIIQQEKETLFKELKESRYEVANVTEEKDALKKDLESQKYQLEKTIGKLQYRLKTAEHDLQLAQKALKKREAVDNTAVKVADKMQKEVTAKRSLVDTLQSKVRWLEDQIDTLVKSKTHLENDKERLKSSLNKTLVQNQQLASELEVANSRTLELKNHVNKLESSLEQSVVRNATTQAQVELFEQEMTRMRLQHQLDVREAVQKATKNQTQHMYRSSSQQKPLQNSEREESARTNQLKPEFTAEKDRIAAQKSSEQYKEIGSELKHLLKEMRNIISDKQERLPRQPVTKPSRPKYRAPSPTEGRRKAFVHYRVPQLTPDISSYSDAEVEDRLSHNRSRSLTGNYVLYSPDNQDSRNPLTSRNHRRSHSAEASYSLPKEVGFVDDSDVQTKDDSGKALSVDLSAFSAEVETSADYGKFSSVSELALHDVDSLQSFSSPVMESTKEDETPRLRDTVPDTNELCKRLEERIISLTRLGGNLQKENKEMADLMKVQGKKLKKVKENEKKIRKTTR